jgi:hypothetical protein
VLEELATGAAPAERAELLVEGIEDLAIELACLDLAEE